MAKVDIKSTPSITYTIHRKEGKPDRTVTVYKPTKEYFIVFELIKFRRLPARFDDIGITVLKAIDE